MSRIVPQFSEKLNPPRPEKLEVLRLTPPGRGAVATILLHGPGALETFAVNWIGPALTDAAGRPIAEHPLFGRFRIQEAAGAEPEILEEVIVHLPEPDAVEIHCHGGAAVISAIEAIFCGRGATVGNLAVKTARTQRDRARRLLPLAPTERTFQILLDQFNGALERERREIRSLSPEEKRCRFQRWRENARLGRHLVEPFHIALAGPVNAGKSRLLNAILGFQRAIVDGQAGTTRDVVSAQAVLEGFPVQFHDTAGFRETDHELERQGIERSADRLASADLVLWIVDATEPEAVKPPVTVPGQLLVCHNKIDLLAEKPPDDADAIWISAAEEQGINPLLERIIRQLIPRLPEPLEAVPLPPV